MNENEIMRTLLFNDEFKTLYHDYVDGTFDGNKCVSNKQLKTQQEKKAVKLLKDLGINVKTVKVSSSGIQFTTDTHAFKYKKAISCTTL